MDLFCQPFDSCIATMAEDWQRWPGGTDEIQRNVIGERVPLG
jgi:hypothetical protein